MTATIEDYKRKVARLEAENRDLRQRLDERDKAARAVERKLRAERDEGVSPQVEALRIQAKAEKERTAQRMRTLAQMLGRLFEANEIRPTRREWADLLAILGVPLGEFATESGEWNRNSRRAGSKHLRHLAELVESGRMTGAGQAGSKGSGPSAGLQA